MNLNDMREHYNRMGNDIRTHLAQINQRIDESVLLQAQTFGRMFEEEHRIVPSIDQTQTLPDGVTNISTSTFIVPQGESWICERVAVSYHYGGSGAALTNVVFEAYRDLIDPTRLAETGAMEPPNPDGRQQYADSFSNRLYLPERTRLIIVCWGENAGVPTWSIQPLTCNLQVRALRPVQNPLPQEETFRRAGGLTQDQQQAEWIADTEPHDGRHGDAGFDDAGLGGDIEPPTPIEAEHRPEPHFGQRVIREVEEIVEHVL